MQETPLLPEYQIGDWLRLRRLKLVTAESCTGGLVGHWVTNVPGSSDYYLGGVVAYANEVKQEILGVQAATLTAHGAVSAETVIEMARGVCQSFARAAPRQPLVGVAVSGIAGPGGGTPDKPVGLVWIGLSGPQPVWAGAQPSEGKVLGQSVAQGAAQGSAQGLARYERAWRVVWQGARQENKDFSARQALLLLLGYLQGKVNE